MKFSGESNIPLPLDDLYEKLANPYHLIKKIPQLQSIEQLDDGVYRFTAKFKTGMFKQKINGLARIVKSDVSNQLVYEIRQQSRLGTALTRITINLHDNAERDTRLSYESETVLSGLFRKIPPNLIEEVVEKGVARAFQSLADDS